MRSKCIRCLKPVALPEYLKNDHLCDTCNEAPEEYPYASSAHHEIFSPIDAIRMAQAAAEQEARLGVDSE